MPATGGDENPRVALGRNPSGPRPFSSSTANAAKPPGFDACPNPVAKGARGTPRGGFRAGPSLTPCKDGSCGELCGAATARARFSLRLVARSAYGNGGDDYIEGGPGKDIMNGSWGNDEFCSGSGGSRDETHCGGGYDFVSVREQKDYVAPDCERVDRR